jgi:hypothetical protein
MNITTANRKEPRATVPMWYLKNLDTDVATGMNDCYPPGPYWKYQMHTAPQTMNSMDAIMNAEFQKSPKSQ